jgi:hypothetical protein
VNRRFAAIGAIGAALALVVAVVAVRVVADEGSGARNSSRPTAATSTTTPPSTSGPRPEVDAVVLQVEAFVTATRGLQFKRPVPVTQLEGQAFKDRLLADSEKSRHDIELSQRALRALDLLEPGVDLYATLQRFFGDAVVGFYDAEKGDLVVRGTGSFTPYARAVLAHELTHALDDQWFDIHRPELDDPGRGEESSAFSALVEGNAQRVEEAYLAQLGAADRRSAQQEEARAAQSADLRGVPAVVPELVSWPYGAGPTFVRALLRAGGERRVDAAFGSPPTTTAEIAEPARYLAGEHPVAVAQPAADGPVLDRDLYGYETLVVTLEPVLGAAGAKRAADGWTGDSYVLWDAGGGRSCVRATFVARNATELAQLADGLQRWSTRSGATVVRAPGTVGFTSCG